MSNSGEMGAMERFTWLLPNGDTMLVTVDRGRLAKAMERRMGRGRRVRSVYGLPNLATALTGAIVATREKTR